MRHLDRTLSPVAVHSDSARARPRSGPATVSLRQRASRSAGSLLLGVVVLHATPLLAQERPDASAPQLASLGGSVKRAPQVRPRGAAAVELAAGACRLGRWAAAVDLMRVVSRSERRADDWLCLARAQRHTGEWVAALDSYDELAESAGKSTRARSARQLGAAEREELEAQLAWIQIVPTTPLPGDAQLTLDGDALAPSLLGVSIPVSPGLHELALEVDGGVQKFVRLRFELGERRRVQFELPNEAATSSAAGKRGAAPNATAVWSRRALVAGSVASAGGLGLMGVSAFAGSAQKGVFIAGTSSLFLGGLSLITGALLRAGASAEPTDSGATAHRLHLQPWLGENVAGVSGEF